MMEISLADVQEALLEEIKDLHLRLAQLRAVVTVSTKDNQILVSRIEQLVEENDELRRSGAPE